MIKFFRKIRQELMEKNKTSMYLKYAVGEIVLVVVGILIALQINNWNESRKLEVQELNFLNNFKISLQSDSTYHSASTERHEVARNSMDILIDHIENDLPYKDSLKYHFASMMSDWSLSFDFTTYEALKSKDLNLITNESLRSNLIEYYSYGEGRGSDLKTRYTDVIEHASKTIISEHFDQMWGGRLTDDSDFRINSTVIENKMIPNDFEALKRDPQFIYFLKTLRNQNYWLVENPFQTTSENYAKIAEDLDKEIARLND
jgi:hypothetical protein